MLISLSRHLRKLDVIHDVLGLVPLDQNRGETNEKPGKDNKGVRKMVR